MLTVSDLRWMEDHRRRAMLRRMPEPNDGASAETGAPRDQGQEIAGACETPGLGPTGRPATADRSGRAG